jgi:hypothetical protein
MPPRRSWVALAFFALGIACRSAKAADWPTAALPLAFGLGHRRHGPGLQRGSSPALEANPAYSTPWQSCLPQ